jgi:hypothetical protein
MEADGPPDVFGAFKWDADKAGTVAIHTFKVNDVVVPPPLKPFGDSVTFAFAFAPKGIYITLGPDPIAALKDALKAKPAAAPAAEALINPARFTKLLGKADGNVQAAETALGKEDKLLSSASLRVSGGKDLSVRFALNLRILPRLIVMSVEPAEAFEDK